MSALDVIDVVDMLEKKHGFTREDAKMLIDFNQARVATKDDLNVININLGNKIESSEQRLDSKIEKEILSVKLELKEEISSVKDEIKDIKSDMKDLRKDFGWIKGMGGAILISIFVQILATVFGR